MQISQRGIDAIKRHEGLRLFAYLDSAGVATIGYGSTEGVRLGQHITSSEAEYKLRKDLDWVEKCIADQVRVPLTQSQYDALCSLIFNIGAGAFADSTLLRKLNAGDYHGAAEEFPRWNKARVNGVMEPLAGLTSRRLAEQSLFREEIDTSPPLVHLGPEPVNTAPRPDQEPYTQEAPMPIPAIVTALLPSVIELLPKLGGLFSSGSKSSERNLAVAGAVLDLAQKTTGAVNAQAAIETMKSDPTALAAVAKAVEVHWFDLTEGGGGGIDGARKADAVIVAGGEPVWKSPSFLIAVGMLPLVYMIVGAVVGLFGAPFSDDVRSAIANGIVGLILGGLIGYYYGQSTSRNRTPAP